MLPPTVPSRTSRRHVGGRAQLASKPNRHPTHHIINRSISIHQSVIGSQPSSTASQHQFLSRSFFAPSGGVVFDTRCERVQRHVCMRCVVVRVARVAGMIGSRCSSWFFFWWRVRFPRARVHLLAHVCMRVASLDRFQLRVFSNSRRSV